VEEMKRSGQGVIPHDGNNQKMLVSGVISLLATGSKRLFDKEIRSIRNKRQP
jgi:hypothetical protein